MCVCVCVLCVSCVCVCVCVCVCACCGVYSAGGGHSKLHRGANVRRHPSWRLAGELAGAGREARVLCHQDKDCKLTIVTLINDVRISIIGAQSG